MRKTFSLVHPKIKPARLIDAAKHDVKKYLKREENKKKPDGVDFWDFDCKFGATEAEAKEIHVSEINKYLNEAEDLKLESFYLEILVKEARRTKKPVAKLEE